MTWMLLAVLAGGAALVAGGFLPTALIGTAVAALPIIAGAVAIVLVYRTNGIINLAQIQLATLAATLFASLSGGAKLLIATHDLCSCLSFVPTASQRMANMVIAAIATILAAAIIWWAAHALIVTRFPTSPLLGTTVTAFLAIGLAGLGPLLRDALVKDVDLSLGRAKETWPVPFAARYHLFGRDVATWELISAALMLILAAALLVALAKTTWGRQLRAVADHAPRAATLGISPFAIGGRSWMLAGMLAGLTGVLQVMADPVLPPAMEASQAGTSLQTAPLLAVLAAAAIANFTRLDVAVIAAIVMTFVSQAATVRFASSAWADALAVVIVAIPLLTNCQQRTREDAGEGLAVANYRPVPRALRNIEQVARARTLIYLVPALLLVGAPVLLSPGQSLILASILSFAILTLSCYLQTGLGGLPALGQVGLATVGGWVVLASGWPLPLALAAAIIAGAAISALITIPTMRLGGMQVAVMTLVFAISAQAFLREPDLAGGAIAGRSATATIAGIDLSDGRILYVGALILLGVAITLVLRVRNSTLGCGLVALRDNPPAGQALGLSPQRYRLVLAAIAGALAALAGAWLVYLAGSLAGGAFTPERSLTVFLYTVVGGLGGLLGPLLGALIFGILEFLAASNPQLATALAGFGGVALLAAAPQGLGGVIIAARDNALVKLAYRYRIAVPSLMGDGGLAAVGGKVPLDEKRSPLRGANDAPLPRYALARTPSQACGGDHE